MRVALVAAVLVIASAFPAVAAGATYSLSCPVADESCAALAERLEVLVAELESQDRDYSTVLAGIESNTGGEGPSEVSGTVALSGEDKDRLDLIWTGLGILIGVSLFALLAPAWHRAFQWVRAIG